MANWAYRVRLTIERTCPIPTKPWEEIDSEILTVHETASPDPSAAARIVFERIIEDQQRQAKGGKRT